MVAEVPGSPELWEIGTHCKAPGLPSITFSGFADILRCNDECVLKICFIPSLGV